MDYQLQDYNEVAIKLSNKMLLFFFFNLGSSYK